MDVTFPKARSESLPLKVIKIITISLMKKVYIQVIYVNVLCTHKMEAEELSSSRCWWGYKIQRWGGKHFQEYNSQGQRQSEGSSRKCEGGKCLWKMLVTLKNNIDGHSVKCFCFLLIQYKEQRKPWKAGSQMCRKPNQLLIIMWIKFMLLSKTDRCTSSVGKKSI